MPVRGEPPRRTSGETTPMTITEWVLVLIAAEFLLAPVAAPLPRPAASR